MSDLWGVVHVQSFGQNFWPNVSSTYLNLSRTWNRNQIGIYFNNSNKFPIGIYFPHFILQQIDLQKLQSFREQVAFCWKIQLTKESS